MNHRLLLVLAGLSLVPRPTAGQTPARAPVVVSPEIAADRRVTFRLAAPKADEVTVTCECLTGPQNLQRDASGLWTTTIGPVPSDIYEYEFHVDGVQIVDPRNIMVKYNSRPGPPSSLLEVPGAEAMFYDLRPVPHGSVDIRWYPSKTTGETRRIHVYTPPGYANSSRRLPVLYLLHGADGDDSMWMAFGHANLILDNLMAEGRLEPMIVVMPFGYANVTPPGADRPRNEFERDLIDDIIPFVQANYRTRADREHRALVGLSMGGGQALNIGLRRLDLFSHVGGFSAAVPRGPATSSFEDIFANAKGVNRSLDLLWLACGTEDGLYTPNKEFSDLLDRSGITHTFRTTTGAHTWLVWRRYLAEIAPQLFR